MDWDEFDKFEEVIDKYMPVSGEGETLASQIVTAVNKLVYKWYNDGDVYDNVHGGLSGWCNDLSSYANWLSEYANVGFILGRIEECYTDCEYEELLYELACTLLDDEYLAIENERPKVGSIYKCDGEFKFEEHYY